MGILINGKWTNDNSAWDSSDGTFHRMQSHFRCPTAENFIAETDRYHLYASLACPWAHRTLIFRELKSLQKIIPITIVHPHMLEHGWQFYETEPLYNYRYLHQLYSKADATYSGRVTVPLLWDKKTDSAVCNESTDIIRIFNSSFNHLTGNSNNYYPKELRSDIDSINQYVYDAINNGVYQCGFATSQSAYDNAFELLFNALDQMEMRLTRQRYLVGNTITEADWRLFTTLIRFDTVYLTLFKCNRNRINDMPNLSNYLRDLYQQPGIADTVNFNHIKQHYHYSHEHINPNRIVAKGPRLDFKRPHNRNRFQTAT